MDLLDNNKYKIDSILGYTTDTNIENILDEDITFNSFTELSDKLGIDKGSIYENHMYSEVYEKMLSKYINKTPVIIEIGVHDTRFPGGCLKFWDLIFPNMEYYGFDIVDCNHLKCNREKITTIIGDQNKPEDLMRMIKTYDLSGKVDFIIDDGSHISEHIITSFKTLYPHIKKGGYYFIEDLHPEYANRDYTISTINSIIDEYKFEVTNKELVNNDKLWIITK
jgi:cephalosporin hydroxylase